ncbi:putative E3 ubiquitin-protein ligase UNKL [Hydractinia symbiolongicarpus]|uniref:putative E3 ubiquitin-protein ligase UNKL n=1 Tax=Hydractinia symbiolongicarpus TaxID=13093 RepID=UPI00254A18C8|nr:putative E3 ubiquitin-protein ligase UNKL [Hydractinia symbiolongicarpus]XP_057310767.1 putative E3 ubiquitin-protein ligase UNKL [Hydractinia symbiolongicarpus]
MAADSNDDFFESGLVNSRKSIAELNQPQTEKPLHYTYLKEFRVDQCQLFLQHKCTQHRPFTCFSWHFLNQKRRRPKKNKNGTFTYSPDVYCQQYNETTGECIHGDDCPFLHRVAGDVERRYHLRYYKTSPCVYETDTRGYCVKNGPHCAFAHGPHDLRQPVYDVRELQVMEQEEKDGDSTKQIVPEDPRWHDTNYVLANYKTETCRKPPRLCRQGYACPQYHNNRDRRRSPRKYKYRSTPCPNVKHGDEWGDPAQCENGDSCAYCHTRTEQQFHPEIYKSTKCNDMQQTAQCPRGPFCAFAHIEQDGLHSIDATKGSISIIPDKELLQRQGSCISDHSSVHNSPLPSPASLPSSRANRSSSLSGPYAKIVEGTVSSLANTSLSSSAPAYEKAPGSGRRSSSRDSDQPQHFFGQLSQSSQGSEPRTPSKGMSISAPLFHPGALPDESALDNALLDAMANVDSTFDFDFPDNASVGSSFGGSTGGSGLNTSNIILGQFSNNGSDPVSIPGTDVRHSSFTSQQSHSPTSPGLQPNANSSFYLNQSGSRASFMRSPKSTPLGLYEMIQSPKFNSPALTSPLALGNFGNNNSDVQRLTEEVMSLRTKLVSWEDSWNQAKQACEAWRREAAEKDEKAKMADRERIHSLIKIGEVEHEVRSLRQELENRNCGQSVHLLKNVSDIEKLPILDLKQIFNQLKIDLDLLEKVISKKESMKCTICEETPRCVVTYPCTHCVMCESCAAKQNECPFCHAVITQKNTIFIPV